MRVERVEEPSVFGFTWPIDGLPDDDPRRTYVEFTLEPVGAGTRVRVVETGFAQLPDDPTAQRFDAHTEGWIRRAGRAGRLPRCRAEGGPDLESVAEQVFIALADPTRRSILAALAAGGPATATDLADRLPITRQAIAKHLALLADVGLVTAEPGERRRVRFRLRSAPMQVAQQFLAALARDWDGPLDALTGYLDRARHASGRLTRPGACRASAAARRRRRAPPPGRARPPMSAAAASSSAAAVPVTASTWQPAARADAMPAGASSTARHRSGGTPSRCAARR